MTRYNSKDHFYFLNGWYDRLFQKYENYDWELGGTSHDVVNLSRLDPKCGCPLRQRTGCCTHNAHWAVLRRTAGHGAEVLFTNSRRLSPEDDVRAQGKWDHLGKPLHGSPQDTIGSPAMLKVRNHPHPKPLVEAGRDKCRRVRAGA